MFRILGKTEHSDITVVDFEQQISEARAEQEQVRREVDQLAKIQEVDDTKEVNAQAEKFYGELREVKAAITEQRYQEQSLILDLEDSTQFVETIEERLNALSASEDMVSILGDVYFKVCPACFQVTKELLEESICHLCKAPIVSSGPSVGHLKMREELIFQLRKSKHLMQQRKSEIADIRANLSKLVDNRKALEAKLAAFQRSLHTADAEIELRLQRIGYLDRSVEDLTARAELARQIEERVSFRDQLMEQTNSLRDQLEMGAGD